MVQFVTLGANEMYARRAILWPTTERFNLHDFRGRTNHLDGARARVRRHHSFPQNFAGYSEEPREALVIVTTQTLDGACSAQDAIKCAGDAAHGVTLNMLFDLVQRQRRGGGLTLLTDHEGVNIALVTNSSSGHSAIVALRCDLKSIWRVRVLESTTRVPQDTRVVTLVST